ncbi:MAG: PQQ-dependent sugar dehydrogenase [Candidatus Zixiibacteriota bacterium]
MKIAVITAFFLLFTFIGLMAGNEATILNTELVASNLQNPVFVTSPVADERLFIVEQTSGLIKILKTGSILPTPFLDISGKISTGGERGLLGLAFHPQFAINGYFYVNYSRSGDGATVIARYSVSANPDLADAGSELIILTISQPYSNHNGGMIAFSPADGYLYIGMGDGGDAGDPNNYAQTGSSLLGKILRIDIDSGTPYAIPLSNPYAEHPTIREEIWAFGFRNPWRWSFDRLSGDLYIADVGQSNLEEIDFQPFNSGGGENYGWRCYEGLSDYNTTNCGLSTDYVFPIYEYGHTNGRCSITGGYVYSGCISDLVGTYFYGDFCTGEIWSFEYNGSTVANWIDRTAELDPPGAATINNIVSFGEDAAGELYIVEYSGSVYKIVPDGGGSGCSSTCGDVNANGAVNILDITFLIAYLYKNGPVPNPPSAGDINNNGVVNILDITYLIAFLYKSGPAPVCG